MPTLCLLTPGTHVGLQSRALHIEIPARDEEPAVDRLLPLVEIERVIIGDATQATTAALAALLELNIPISFCSWSGRVLGLLRPPSNASAALRLEQYRRCLDPAFCLAQAQTIIEAKILNQRRILQRLAANRNLDITAATDWFNTLIQHTGHAPTTDALRGLEGTASARYYDELSRFFPATFPFERRSRRPPHNPVNAVLSYAYTVLAGEIEATLWTCGLDPALGFYHSTEDRRASLALDLLEPFRAPICDALAVDLFSHEMLNASHFERRASDDRADSGAVGCYLTVEGRKKFFVQYERRLERQFTYEFTGQRTSLRQLIERQCLDLKKTILEGAPFVPFLMN